MTLRITLVLAALLALLAFVLWWSVGTANGSRWLLRAVPGLAVLEARGPLLGDFSARRVEWSPATGVSVAIDGLAWRGMAARATPFDALRAHVELGELSADRVTLQAPPSPEPATRAPPEHLQLPIELHIERLRIGELRTGGAGAVPIKDIEARVHLGADDGARHQLDRVRLARDGIVVDGGSASIASSAPFATRLTARLASAAADWRATIDAKGPLQRLQAQATLTARGMAAEARATLLPFAPWPLPALDASARGLDLARLASGAPSTSIDGLAHIEGDGWARPARVAAEFVNHRPGRYDDGALPVRRVELQARARPDRPQQLDATTLAIEFGDAREPAGRFDGRASLDHDRLALDGRIAQLRTDRLDARLAPLALDGPVAARIDGMGGDNRFDVQATLDGGVLRRRAGPLQLPHRAQLQIDVAGVAADIELRKLVVRAGAANAQLSGRAQRVDERSWQVAGKVQLDRFDPLPFWAGGADSPWRRGPHRVNANSSFDLRIAPPAQPSLDTWLAAVGGDASLIVADGSVLAGLPVKGNVALNARGGRVQVKAALDAAGNAARIDGAAAANAPGDDRWQVEVNAPQLAALSPLLALLQQPPIAGGFDANARIVGRWPRSSGDGDAALRGFAFGSDITVNRADARWSVGTTRDAPLDVRLDIVEARLAPQQPPITGARLRVTGSLAEHRIDGRVTSPLRPPAWLEQAAATSIGDATVARLRGQGGVSAEGWSGTIDELQLGAAVRGSRSAWLAARDLKLAAGFDAASRSLTSLVVEPGAVDVLGARLGWQRLRWSAAQRQLDIAAQLEPLAVAPWLARLQPGFGWGGDLAVRGRIDVKSAPSFAADIVIERAGGDLSVADPLLPDSPPQKLGLTDLRLALDAHDGVWHFTQALAGTSVGVAVGAQSLRVAPSALWPPADTPLEGAIEARVADLGVWGAWLPAGWRLSGNLLTAAALGGSFGAPEYTGRMTGSGIGVRNVLEGVNVVGGEVAVALQGATARIEHLRARAGDGRIELSGDARFGATPQAQLRLVAERFQVLGRVDRRVVASGSAALGFDADAVALDGRFAVDEGLIDIGRADAPKLSDDVEVLRPGNAAAPEESEPAPAPQRRRRDVKLDLRVELGERLRLRGRGLDGRLAGELRLTTVPPRSRLAVAGTVRVVDGTYAAYGQKLEIERGSLTFTGPLDNPRLDIFAKRPNLDIEVGVAVSGTAQSPRVRLASKPEMSDTDKLSWLVLGRAPDGLGRTDTALLQRAALALLAGEGGGGGPTDALTKAIGLDDLSLRQSDGEVRETIVSLGKQLGRRWYVGYERSLNATTGTWQLIYRIAQRFTLRAQSGLDNSLDLIWTWRWQ